VPSKAYLEANQQEAVLDELISALFSTIRASSRLRENRFLNARHKV
jgi:hypothetical protein